VVRGSTSGSRPRVTLRAPATENGVTRFTIGTGGNSLGTLSSGVDAGLRAYGVIEMTLNAGDYSWAFVDVTGKRLDSGSRSCQLAPFTALRDAPEHTALVILCPTPADGPNIKGSRVRLVRSHPYS
jgi:hypothetical protein